MCEWASAPSTSSAKCKAHIHDTDTDHQLDNHFNEDFQMAEAELDIRMDITKTKNKNIDYSRTSATTTPLKSPKIPKTFTSTPSIKDALKRITSYKGKKYVNIII